MMLRDAYLEYQIFVLKNFKRFHKDTLIKKTIKLLKPYDDSYESTKDAIENAVKYGLLYVVLKDEKLVGISVVVNFRLNGFIPTYHNAYLGIDKKHQRKGLAKRVVELSIRDAGGEMSLHVDLDNKAAEALYSKLGYKHLYNRYLYGRAH